MGGYGADVGLDVEAHRAWWIFTVHDSAVEGLERPRGLEVGRLDDASRVARRPASARARDVARAREQDGDDRRRDVGGARARTSRVRRAGWGEMGRLTAADATAR